MNDWKWLQKFVKDGDDDSFARVVKEHLGLVYATALRVTSDAAASEDITQSVFILLADKADLLKPHGSLASWLYQSTVFKSRKYLARESKRALKEEKCAIMKEDTESTPNDWNEIRPLIDAALDELSEEDRSAILLRFFQEASYQTIGARLSVSEEAARKRVTRAVNRLQAWFATRGMRGTEETMTRQLSGVILAAPPAHLFQDTLNAVASKSIGATAAAGGSLTSGLLAKPLVLVAFLSGSAIPASQFFFNEEPPKTAVAQEETPTAHDPQSPVNSLPQLAQDEWSLIWQESLPPKGDLQTLLNRIASIEDPFKRDLFKAMAAREWATHGLPFSDNLKDKYFLLEDLIATDPHRAAQIVKDLPTTQANLSSKLASLAQTTPEALGHFIRLLEVPRWRDRKNSYRISDFAAPKVSEHERARSIRDAVKIAFEHSPQEAEAILNDLDGWHLEHALAGMMSALAPQNIDEAISLLNERLDNPGTKGRALSSYLASWNVKDPQKALTFLDEFTKNSDNRKQFGTDPFSFEARSRIIANLAEHNFDAALKVLQNEKKKRNAASQLADIFAKELVKDPEKILSSLSVNYKKTGALNALSKSLHQNPMMSFPKVWEWCQNEGPTPFVKSLMASSIIALADTNPGLAISCYQKNPSLFITPPYHYISYSFVRTPPQEFFNTLDRIPQEYQDFFAIGQFQQMHRSGKLWSDDEKTQLYETLSPNRRPEVARILVQELALTYPQEAIARAAEFETPAEVNSATQEIVAQWTTFDPAAASNWVDELDRSTQREAATVELVNQFTEQTNFESAWAWALNLDPGPVRTNSLLTVIKKIDQIQSTSAAQLWMQDEALSQIEFNSLKNALESSK